MSLGVLLMTGCEGLEDLAPEASALNPLTNPIALGGATSVDVRVQALDPGANGVDGLPIVFLVSDPQRAYFEPSSGIRVQALERITESVEVSGSRIKGVATASLKVESSTAAFAGTSVFVATRSLSGLDGGQSSVLTAIVQVNP